MPGLVCQKITDMAFIVTYSGHYTVWQNEVINRYCFHTIASIFHEIFVNEY